MSVMQLFDLTGKVALITGSSKGIGRAIAEGLAAAGCNIVLHGLEFPAEVDEVRAAIAVTSGVEVGYVRTDLSDPDAIESLVGKVHSTHGGVDVLVNNAVVRHFAPVEAFPRQAWDAALAVNVSAAFHLIRLTLPGMRAGSLRSALLISPAITWFPNTSTFSPL